AGSGRRSTGLRLREQVASSGIHGSSFTSFFGPTAGPMFFRFARHALGAAESLAGRAGSQDDSCGKRASVQRVEQVTGRIRPVRIVEPFMTKTAFSSRRCARAGRDGEGAP